MTINVVVVVGAACRAPSTPCQASTSKPAVSEVGAPSGSLDPAATDGHGGCGQHGASICHLHSTHH